MPCRGIAVAVIGKWENRDSHRFFRPSSAHGHAGRLGIGHTKEVGDRSQTVLLPALGEVVDLGQPKAPGEPGCGAAAANRHIGWRRELRRAALSPGHPQHGRTLPQPRPRCKRQAAWTVSRPGREIRGDDGRPGVRAIGVGRWPEGLYHRLRSGPKRRMGAKFESETDETRRKNATFARWKLETQDREGFFGGFRPNRAAREVAKAEKRSIPSRTPGPPWEHGCARRRWSKRRGKTRAQRFFCPRHVPRRPGVTVWARGFAPIGARTAVVEGGKYGRRVDKTRGRTMMKIEYAADPAAPRN